MFNFSKNLHGYVLVNFSAYFQSQTRKKITESHNYSNEGQKTTFKKQDGEVTYKKLGYHDRQGSNE